MLTNIPTTTLSGRSVLRTDLDANPSSGELKKDLERVLPQHNYNLGQIRELQEYLKGWHPAIQDRVKTTRTDVDNKITVDYAYSITRDIVGYFLGKPVQYTQREGKFRTQMQKFNDALKAESKALVDYQIAEHCSVCGVGYRGIFSEASARNGTHLKLLCLNPLTTFVVYSTDPLKPPVYAVTSYESAATESPSVVGTPSEVVTYYKVYTTNKQITFKTTTGPGQVEGIPAADLELVDEKDILFGGGLPIVEYENNQWRLGDWEVAVALMDALDAVTSDGVNDIQQAVNSVLVAMGMELTKDQFDNLSVNGFLNVKDIPPGVKPVVEFINQAMEADVGVSMRDYLEATLRVIVGVPDRKTRGGGGGGDTGDAVFMRDGWQDIDLVATAKEQYFIQAERDALSVMLYILDVHNETKKLAAQDIDIHFNRNKTANLQSKAQVYQTLTSGDAPIAPVDALDIAGLTNNVPDVILRAESYAAERAKKRIEEKKAAQALKNDESDSGKKGDPSKAGDEDGTD